jgi:anti-anti-sigma regulatory factor
VALDLLVDDQPVLTVLADGFRQDLLDAGFGTGHHGFTIDLSQLSIRSDQVIRVLVAVHAIELGNGGRRLEAYQG